MDRATAPATTPAGAEATAPEVGARALAPAPVARGAWAWLGRVPFAPTAALQERLRSAVIDGTQAETLLLLEHAPVITLGRGAVPEHVLAGAEALAGRGVTVHRASRGGDVTYHGPGQLVGYPIVRLRRGVRAHVEAMAAALIEVLGELGVQARYRSDAPGLWVGVAGATAFGRRGEAGGESKSEANIEAKVEAKIEAKICAFGINVHRRVAVHGFALNLDPDLEAFSLIVPCGLTGSRVTSVRAVTGGAAPAPAALAPRVAAALGRHLGLELVKGESMWVERDEGADGADDNRDDQRAPFFATVTDVDKMEEA